MKNKKSLILIISLISVLIITAVIITILYFTTDMFVSEDKLFLKYVSQNSKILEVLKNENVEEQKRIQESSSYVTRGTLNVSMANQNQMGTQTINAVTTSKYDINTGRSYSDFTLKNGQVDLMKASYINSGDVYAIKIDEILGNYIGIRNSGLKQLAKNMGLDDSSVSAIPDSIDLKELLAEYGLTEEEKKYIKETYIKVVQESINKENYSKLDKTQITIFDKNYNCNVYSLKLSGEEIKQIIINCLNKMKEDEIVLGILDRLAADIVQVDTTELIDDIIIKTQEEMLEGNLEILVYENNKKLLRTIVEIQEQMKLTIDFVENELEQKVNLILEQYGLTTSMNVITNEGESTLNQSSMQIKFLKRKDTNGITNEIEIIPNNNEAESKVIINKTNSGLKNNTIQNVATTTIINSGGEYVQATYNKTTEITQQIEEIPELKNSNTVIFNNYTLEQLAPFMSQLTQRTEEIIGKKIQELNLNDGTIILPALLSSGISMVNANGVEVDSISSAVSCVGITLGIYLENSIVDATNTMQNQLQNQEIMQINSTFRQFEGEKSGSNVRTLCDMVKNYNASYAQEPAKQIVIVMNSASQITSEPSVEVLNERIEQIKSQISFGKTYIVDFGYSSSTGKIVAIGIVEK